MLVVCVLDLGDENFDDRNTAWNCQNWIVEVLAELNTQGFDVESYSQVELQELLSRSMATGLESESGVCQKSFPYTDWSI
jgi:hypothetical protein